MIAAIFLVIGNFLIVGIIGGFVFGFFKGLPAVLFHNAGVSLIVLLLTATGSFAIANRLQR